MIAPTDRKLVSSKAMPMTSPAGYVYEKGHEGGQVQNAPVRSALLNVIFKSNSFLLQRNENNMDIMPATAMPSVKSP